MTRETEFGSFETPCDEYDGGEIFDNKYVNDTGICVYCGHDKLDHQEFATGQSL